MNNWLQYLSYIFQYLKIFIYEKFVERNRDFLKSKFSFICPNENYFFVTMRQFRGTSLGIPDFVSQNFWRIVT